MLKSIQNQFNKGGVKPLYFLQNIFMSSKQKNFVRSIKRGEFGEWLFGQEHDEECHMNDFVVHTEYPRFIAHIAPNSLALETNGIEDDSPVLSGIYGMGDDAYIITAWEGSNSNEDICDIKWFDLVNLDDAFFDLNKVMECCISGTLNWILITAFNNEENYESEYDY